MKWRSVEELPKIDGIYKVLIEREEVGFVYIDKSWDNKKWSGSSFPTLAWLDPEVPEEFLKPKEPEKKPCPWCHTKSWEISKIYTDQTYYFRCYFTGCNATGPQRETRQEAEAAIFERVK